MILHKYIDEKGKCSIEHSELKVSIPSEFNDPFEFLPRDVTIWTNKKKKTLLFSKQNLDMVYETYKNAGLVKNKKQFKRDVKDKEKYIKIFDRRIDNGMIWSGIQGMKDYADQVTRVISFSSEKASEYDQILMWSHYTDKHKGIRIHFDTSKFRLQEEVFKEVEYLETRVPFDALLSPKSKAFLDQVNKFLITKSIAWYYEKEYRLILTPNYCYSKDNLNFYKILPECIVKIDLGFNSNSILQNEIITLLKRNENKHIILTRAFIDEKEYKLNYKQLNFV
jgi:Protein of unknown function (DUF2971)